MHRSTVGDGELSLPGLSKSGRRALFTHGDRAGGGSARWTRAAEISQVISESGNEATRAFCLECGSQLFASSSGRRDFIGIKAGSLDDPSWFKPMSDVWVASAQPWDCLDPAIPKMPKGRPPSGSSDGGRITAMFRTPVSAGIGTLMLVTALVSWPVQHLRGRSAKYAAGGCLRGEPDDARAHQRTRKGSRDADRDLSGGRRFVAAPARRPGLRLCPGGGSEDAGARQSCGDASAGTNFL